MASTLRTGAATLPIFIGTITAAGTATGDVVAGLGGAEVVALHANFDYGSGGTNVTAYVQTSLDLGTTWMDIACFVVTTADARRVFTVGPQVGAGTAMVTPNTLALAASTQVPGVLGDRLRVQVVSTGTYGGATTLAIHAAAKG